MKTAISGHNTALLPSLPVPATPSHTSELLGVRFANIGLNEALAVIGEQVSVPASKSLFFVNTHCLNLAFDDARYRNALRHAALVLPDGSGVKLGCQLNADPLQENLNGTDLFPHLCQQFAATGKSVYFLGGRQGVAARVAQWAQTRYPGLSVAGCHHGYFTADEESRVIADIRASGADVLFVAMGVPRQELWLSANQHRLGTRLNLAVGGLFDFYSGAIPRAPLWLRRLGMEWMARLYHEPSRMWQRYLVGNPLYLFRLLREKNQRQGRSRPPARRFARTHLWHARLKAAATRLAYRFSLWSQARSKRLTDILLSLYGLLMLTPVFLLVALAIKLDSKGPVFYTQQRAGLRARPFKMWKFRSMHVDADARRKALEALNEMSDGVTFKVKNDPRITRTGRFIRRYSIDELPQLINVLIGDMSVVGPRPALFDELTRYELQQRERLDTVPGLTSPWVIAGRSGISFAEQARLDIEYLRQRSFWSDLKLILQTIPIVLTGRGAC